MIELNELTIQNLRKKYGEEKTYLFCDFLGGLNAAEKLYIEPAFNYHNKMDFQNFSECTFENIDLILKVIDQNIPNLSRIKAEKAKINIAFCRNLWLHELLLDESWENKDHKLEYLNYAFQHIFKEFDTKAVSCFNIEFLPYDMPWGSIAYHLVPSQNLIDQEKDVYESFYKTSFLESNKFFAYPIEKLRLNDALNFILRISNKLKDHKFRLMYFDFKRFQFYEEFSKLVKEESISNSMTKSFLSSFFYYELIESIIWNSAFFLSAIEFRKLIDSIRGQSLEKLHSIESSEREKIFQQLIQQIKTITPKKIDKSKSNIKNFNEKTNLKNSKFEIQSITQTSYYTKDEIKYELPDVIHKEKYLHQDLKIFLEIWDAGIRIRSTFMLFDNYQILNEKEKEYISDFKKFSSKISEIKSITRDIRGNLTGITDIKELYSTSYNPPLLEEKFLRVASYLFNLNQFNKDLVDIIAENLKIGWKSEEWEELGNHEWIQSRTKNWFYINQTQNVRDMIKPISINNFSIKCRKSIFKYLEKYESKLHEETKIAKLDSIIYGFIWFKSITVKHWLSQWLNSLVESDFQFTDQITLIGSQNENLIMSKLNTNLSFEDIFSLMTRKIRKKLENEPSQFTKKESIGWVNEIIEFCEQGLCLNISIENRLLYLKAGQSLLFNLNRQKHVFEKFVNFCESEKIIKIFSGSTKSYIWFLIELYKDYIPYSYKIKKYFKEYIKYPVKNVEDWSRSAEAYFYLENLHECLISIKNYLQFKPFNISMLKNLINVLILLKKYDEAEKNVDEILKNASLKDLGLFKILKGRILKSKGKTEESQKFFRTTIEDEELDNALKANIWNEIGEMIPENDLTEKENAFKKVLFYEPDNFCYPTCITNLHRHFKSTT